jgi:hypothetical protein
MQSKFLDSIVLLWFLILSTVHTVSGADVIKSTSFESPAWKDVIDAYTESDNKKLHIASARCVAILNIARQFEMFKTDEDLSNRKLAWSRLMSLATKNYREEGGLDYDSAMTEAGSDVLRITKKYFEWLGRDGNIEGVIAELRSQDIDFKNQSEAHPFVLELRGCMWAVLN